ncbi:MAG: class A beta-lactamase-related serine hydrolase, partial [Flavobacterium sp.]|nr:class A beta-lactamase-related serine hydrolase [Flavobacterium sp.]
MKQLTFLFSILLALPGYSQSDIPSRLAAYLQAQTDVNGFSGAVLVANKDTILLQQAYGLANYDWKIRNTPDTKFGLASVSKQFTAVAILQLVESGKLSLDSRLNTFFPGFPKGDTVTIHMLLAHTSGLDADFDELYLKSTQLSNDSVLAAIEKKPYLFSPGTAC